MANSTVENVNSTESPFSQKQLAHIHDFINTYLCDNLRLEELASLTNSSPWYFSRQFKRATGLPPRQYLIQQRLEKAKALLEGGELSIAEVAHIVGFFDQSHFVRYFKTRVGTTPKDYRRGKLEQRLAEAA
jgi:AraC family transcriptional regulator